MTYRPYPNADRALRQVQRTRAVYQYGRVPQRYILGFDHEKLAVDARRALAVAAEATAPILRAVEGVRAPAALAAAGLAQVRHAA